MGFRWEYGKALVGESFDWIDRWQRLVGLAVLVFSIVVYVGVAAGEWEADDPLFFAGKAAALLLGVGLIYALAFERPARLWQDRPRADVAVSTEGASWTVECEFAGASMLLKLHSLREQTIDRVFCVVEDPSGVSVTSEEDRARVVRNDGSHFWHQFPQGFPAAPETPESGTYRVNWYTRLTDLDRKLLARADFDVYFTDQGGPRDSPNEG